MSLIEDVLLQIILTGLFIQHVKPFEGNSLQILRGRQHLPVERFGLAVILLLKEGFCPVEAQLLLYGFIEEFDFQILIDIVQLLVAPGFDQERSKQNYHLRILHRRVIQLIQPLHRIEGLLILIQTPLTKGLVIERIPGQISRIGLQKLCELFLCTAILLQKVQIVSLPKGNIPEVAGTRVALGYPLQLIEGGPITAERGVYNRLTKLCIRNIF